MRGARLLLESTLTGRVLTQAWHGMRARRAHSLLRQAEILHQRGEVDLVLQKLDQVLALDPPDSAVHCLLGRAFAQAQQYGIAQRCFQRANKLDPFNANAYIDCGTVYRLQGDLAAAEANYRRALAIDSAAPMANYYVALFLIHRALAEDALKHLRLAHAAAPSRGEILKLLVATLVSCDKFEEAVAVSRAATEADPGSYEAWLCSGIAYQKLNQPQQALVCYERGRQLQPDDAELLHHNAIALQDIGQVEKAFESYEAALALKPDFVLSRFHRALTHLMVGNYAPGWRDYEMRLLSADVPVRGSSRPKWDGRPLTGRSILTYGEQGIGDEILFASCLPDLIRDSGDCFIECAPKLQKLFQRSFPMAKVCIPDETEADGDCFGGRDIDCEVPIGSLPLHYRTRAEDFPKHTGYLKADPERVAAWTKKLAAIGGDFKVGISWRGGTLKTRGAVRSVSLEQWAPILATPGVMFVNLQYGEGAELEVEALPYAERTRIVSWKEAVSDYEDTAAVVTALDLTLSVSTSLVDLVGALGGPLWVMVPSTPDWRYGYAAETMPWYPSARLFRQSRLGNWRDVIETVRDRLQEHRRSARAA